jgi:hypothetical protein
MLSIAPQEFIIAKRLVADRVTVGPQRLAVASAAQVIAARVK